MSWIAKARSGLDMVSICVAAVETIGAIRKSIKDKGKALELIGDIVDRVVAGWQGTMKPEDIRAAMNKMMADLASNDAAADAAADEKFGPKG